MSNYRTGIRWVDLKGLESPGVDVIPPITITEEAYIHLIYLYFADGGGPCRF